MSQQERVSSAPPADKTGFDEEVERRNWIKIAAVAGLAVVAVAYPLVFTMPYQQHLGILIFMYALMAVGWNIIGGYTGQVSLGNTVFFGVGAYTSTFLLMNFLLSPWIGMVAGALLSVLVAVVIGYPTFRLKGHYFAIATIAVAEIVYVIVLNTEELGAAVGLALPILPESWINMQFHGTNKTPYYYIILTFLALSMYITHWIERSKLGYYFRAIKADPEGARAIGVPITQYKVVAFAISGVLASIAGTFYAQYVLFIDPFSVLYLQISIAMVLMVVLGGLGTVWGPIIGAVVLISISETARLLVGGTGSALDLMIYGFLVMVVAVFQPLGLMGMLKGIRRRKA